MAEQTLKSDRFVVGGTVTAYPVSNWTTSVLPPTGAPVGSSAGVAGTVAADGSVTVTGLRTKTEYVAYSLVGAEHRYVRFRAAGTDGREDDIDYVAVSTAASGDTTLVAAIPGKRIQVIGYAIVSTSANSVKFKSGAGTDLTGAMAFGATGGLSSPSDRNTVEFQTAVGQALVINLSAATQVSGHLVYRVA